MDASRLFHWNGWLCGELDVLGDGSDSDERGWRRICLRIDGDLRFIPTINRYMRLILLSSLFEGSSCHGGLVVEDPCGSFHISDVILWVGLGRRD